MHSGESGRDVQVESVRRRRFEDESHRSRNSGRVGRAADGGLRCCHSRVRGRGGGRERYRASEIEDGKLQLSVYTKKDGKYFEVIVDHETGGVSKTEEIEGGDDLKAAQRQDRAMTKAKLSLQKAVEKSLKAHAGAKAIRASAYMSRKGHAMADIDIVAGGRASEAPQRLD
ncbi:MAG: hypothetical protein DMF89_24260 [Acidobacteria bacterium]|nr:MAG: hypothetical protein DMF89_24260 [Acidobacteriota bacterium]